MTQTLKNQIGRISPESSRRSKTLRRIREAKQTSRVHENMAQRLSSILRGANVSEDQGMAELMQHPDLLVERPQSMRSDEPQSPSTAIHLGSEMFTSLKVKKVIVHQHSRNGLLAAATTEMQYR